MNPRVFAVLVAFDRFVNVVFGGRADETISSRSAKARRDGKAWGCILCKLLDRLDPNHCDLSLKTDKNDAKEEVDSIKES